MSELQDVEPALKALIRLQNLGVSVRLSEDAGSEVFHIDGYHELSRDEMIAVADQLTSKGNA